MKKIILLVFITAVLMLSSNVFAFNFHNRYITVKDYNSISNMIVMHKDITISDFRALLRNWYNLAAGGNSFLLSKDKLYINQKNIMHKTALAKLAFKIISAYPNLDYNQAGKYDQTPLYIAIRRGFKRVLLCLLMVKNLSVSQTDIKTFNKHNTFLNNKDKNSLYIQRELYDKSISTLNFEKIKCKILKKEHITFKKGTKNRITGVIPIRKKIYTTFKKICNY